jgi:hypothetical protein
VVDRFCTTPSGLEVVVVVVVSDDDEGGGVTTGAGGGAAPYSVVVVVSLVVVGAHAVQTSKAKRANRDDRPRFPILHFSYSPKNSMNERARRSSLSRGNFCSRLAGFGQANSDCLFAALHLFA